MKDYVCIKDNFQKKTMYLADTLPKNIVNLLGSTNVGIAKTKIVMRPTYKKMLKINDFINCIKN